MPAAVVTSTIDSNVKTELFANATMQNSIAMVKPSSLATYSMSVAAVESFGDEDDAKSALASKKAIIPKSTSLMSPWVRENMKKDLIHLANLENSGGISAPLKERVEAEFLASLPKTLPECNNIVTGTIVKHEKS